MPQITQPNLKDKPAQADSPASHSGASQRTPAGSPTGAPHPTRTPSQPNRQTSTARRDTQIPKSPSPADLRADGPRITRIRKPVIESPTAQRIRQRTGRARIRRRLNLTLLLALLLIGSCLAILIGAMHRASDTPQNPVTTEEQSPSPETDPHTLLPLTDPSLLPIPPDVTVICIDPGHGFRDPGTSSDFLLPFYEKDVNLAIALYLRDELIARGYEVVMTRDTDEITEDWQFGSTFTPEDRIYLLSTLPKVDYFISIHCNSYALDPSASGARIYYYTGNSAQTPALAQAVSSGIQRSIGDELPSLNAYREAQAFTVTRHSICPALLIEVGFVTNPKDAMNMITPAWQASIAQGIANGIHSHIQTQLPT